ncbi:hypothetical protein Afil01_17410 [Actinorhabdospora filicis]|uniref:Uncharacterized protein n=1 Tax=Actinorhabdospora filicis TaxID=1785913 RepID=A0A9W6SGX2_9ACTN|nr:hypothetical protein [Actinorhabdospora filicis]GLZ76934.1 hypothetical protein Afil01_17410 [Actinorhabdospora filicis]
MTRPVLTALSVIGAVAAVCWAGFIALLSPAVCRGGGGALMCSTGGLLLIAAPFVLTAVGGVALVLVTRGRLGWVAIAVQLAGACLGVYLSSR